MAAVISSKLWNGGPPPIDDPTWSWVHQLVLDVGKFMSVSDAMAKHNMDAITWQYLADNSPWFLERLNVIKNIKRMDVELATMQAAIGHRQLTSDGSVLTDADGIPIRMQRDGTAAKYLLEREERRSGVLLGVSGPASSATDDALSTVRRTYGLMQAFPWTTLLPSGEYVLEVGMFNTVQINKLGQMGISLPDAPGLWFVQMSADRRDVVAVRDQRYEEITGTSLLEDKDDY